MKDDDLDKAMTKLSQNVVTHMSSNCGQIHDEMMVALKKETWKDGKPKKHLPRVYENLLFACVIVLREYRKTGQDKLEFEFEE